MGTLAIGRDGRRGQKEAKIVATMIYHITHLDNLSGIIETGNLLSDRQMVDAGGHTVIGFNHIKRRRLEEIAVPCYPGTMVGDFVPFYFCPRSIMLYIIEKRRDELAYKGGQKEVVHLVSSVQSAMDAGCTCAFTPSSAATKYNRNFHRKIEQLDEILDWDAIRTTNWGDPGVKDRKQAEFLTHDHFPWAAIESIGTFNADVRDRVQAILANTDHRPTVTVQGSWYYH